MTKLWKCGARFNASPQRCTNVTAPHCDNFNPKSSRARRRSSPKTTPDENIQDIAQQTGVVGQAVAQCKWNRQHPLPDRNHGKDVVDEMRGRLRHASSPTRRTPAAPAAGKRNKAVVPARIAVDTYKPAG